MLEDTDYLRVFSPFNNSESGSNSKHVCRGVVVKANADVHIEQEEEFASSSVEPYSGALVVSAPRKFRILHFLLESWFEAVCCCSQAASLI